MIRKSCFILDSYNSSQPAANQQDNQQKGQLMGMDRVGITIPELEKGYSGGIYWALSNFDFTGPAKMRFMAACLARFAE